MQGEGEGKGGGVAGPDGDDLHEEPQGGGRDAGEGALGGDNM